VERLAVDESPAGRPCQPSPPPATSPCLLAGDAPGKCSWFSPFCGPCLAIAV